MKIIFKKRLTRKILALSFLILILMMPFISMIPLNYASPGLNNNIKSQAENSGEDSILWKLGKGLPGTGATMQPKLVSFTDGGEKLIVVGTNGGIATITLNGLINMSYKTFGDVIDFEIIEDISGDSASDIVLITYDQEYPNLIAITSNNGSEIWKFKPTIEGIDPTTYATHDFITNTWDIKIINDINDDSVPEIAISSWFRLFIVSGKDGNELWINENDFTNDIWKLEVLEDINGNGFDTIIAGSEEGKLGAFDSKDGTNLWTYDVEKTALPAYVGMGFGEQEVPNSIDDIKIISDIDYDDYDDILIAADDGYIRLISGVSGLELDNVLCYDMANITTPLYSSQITTSPYTSVKRIFMKSGIKIYEIPDINNDSINEYISIACDLDYKELDQYFIYGKIFNINPESEVDKINITTSLNWSCNNFYFGSYPEIIDLESNIQIYLYSLSGWGYQTSVINRYDIDDEKSQNPITVYEDSDTVDYSYSSYYIPEKEEGHYLLNIGDVNSDGVDDLFAISANGRYLCIDCKNDKTIWVRTKSEAFETELVEIEDLNNDGLEDFLVKRIGIFEPSWIISNDGGYTEEQEPEAQIINELFVIDAKTGNIIWSFNIPSPQYYGGLMDLLNIGDINNDNISDYAAWIIPSEIPPEISDIIRTLSGEDTLPSGSTMENVYRALLYEYTKILAIDGSDGAIFWNTSLLGFPYKFYRHYEYNGNYTDPIEVDTGEFQIINRISEKFPDSWISGSNIEWDYDWKISTLSHANVVQIENGSSSDSIIDLQGDQGTNYTITSQNSSESSKSLKYGTTSNSTSIGTIESGDNLYWVINSINNKTQIELSFIQSQNIGKELQYLVIDYKGFILNNPIEQIDISIYNYSDGHWIKLSTNEINQTDTDTKMTKHLQNITGLTTGPNDLVKIKLEAQDSSLFALKIDLLVVNYIYTYGNYSVKAAQDGSSWKAILNLTIPVDLSDDKSLGLMDYPLSQIERFSALKMQSSITVNTITPTSWYNFTYEIYDAATNKWVLCNWSRDSSTWNNQTYHDLHGDFKTTDRDNYLYFDLTNDSYKYDHMYLITRGTNDADSCVGFDYENKTTLSNFIDSNHNIQIRINVTNGNEEFNLTIDSFGIGTFYWGLFDWDSGGVQYDRYYIYNYNQDQFSDKFLLNLEIQDFEVINGTDDKYLDVIALIGVESLSYYGYTNWSTRIRLFDIKNEQVFTKWSINHTLIPTAKVQILPLNNSLNNWLLSGAFQFGNTNNCSHKLVSNPHWTSQITNFDNFSESKVEMDYAWEIIPPFYTTYEYLYEFPGKATISKDGKIGIIIGEYGWTYPYEWEPELREYGLTYIQIIDINTRSTISKIPTTNLITFGSSTTAGKIDFSSEGAGYRLLFSYEDFDGDNYLDHVGLYEYYSEQVDMWVSGNEFIVYSGNSADNGPIILFRKLFENTGIPSSSSSDQNKLKMSFASIGDCNNDGISDIIIGLQAMSYGSGWDYCKGSEARFYDISSSDENNAIELTDYYWELDPFSCLIPWATPSYEFFNSIENIGDINGDNKGETLIERNSYVKTTTQYGEFYTAIPTTEILDVINRTTLYRFKMDIDSIFPIDDLNEDGKKELLVSSGELIFCVNSKFKIQMLNPIDGQALLTHNFNIEWDTDSNYDYFEVLVDGISQGSTTSKSVPVSLSAGWKQINIVMYDRSGLIIAINTISVLVAPNFIQYILTFVIIGVAVGSFIVYRRFRKKEKEMVLIDKKINKGGKK